MNFLDLPPEFIFADFVSDVVELCSPIIGIVSLFYIYKLIVRILKYGH